MANANGKSRKKDSARLIWDTKPRPRPEGVWQEVVTAIETESTLVDQPLKTQLEYRVIAINKSGVGSPSNTVMAVL
jgi:hypothetical protein